MKRSWIIVLSICVLFLVPLTSWGQTNITWMEWPRPNQDEFVKLILDSFHEKNPDIRVTYRPMTNENQVIVAMAAGTSPDIIAYWGDLLVSWMQTGAFLNLDTYLDEVNFDFQDFNAMQLQAFAMDGSQYLLPQYLGTTAMFYNKDHFAEAGYPLPDSSWTWEDRREMARKLTVRTDDTTVRWGTMLPQTSIDRWANLISANGGLHHPPGDNSVILWDQPEAIEAMEYWRAMFYDDRSAPTVPDLLDSDYRKTFSTGMVSTYETLPIDIAHYVTADFEMGITQVPAGPVKRVSLATLDGYGIWSGSPNKEAAFKFLMHLVSPEANELRASLQSLQPARRSVLMEWIDINLAAYPFVTQDDMIQFYTSGEFAEPMPGFANPDITGRDLRRALSRIYTNNEPPAIVMAEEIPVINAKLREASGK